MNGLIGILLLAAVASAVPGGFRYLTPRAVMIGGYLGHPSKGGMPHHAMTGFAAGDTIATNAFVDGQATGAVAEEGPVAPAAAPVVEAETEKSAIQEDAAATPAAPEDEAAVQPAAAPGNPTKQIAKAKPQQDEDEDAKWPFAGRSNVPSYNAFFPIVIGGHGGKTRSEEGGAGGATAIANSFSTGRGGIASSQASSFGDPSLGQFLKTLNGKAAAKKQE